MSNWTKNSRRPRQFSMLLSDEEWDDLLLVAEFEDTSASDVLRRFITRRAYALKHAVLQDFRCMAEALDEFASRLRAVAAVAERPSFRALGSKLAAAAPPSANATSSARFPSIRGDLPLSSAVTHEDEWQASALDPMFDVRNDGGSGDDGTPDERKHPNSHDGSKLDIDGGIDLERDARGERRALRRRL